MPDDLYHIDSDSRQLVVSPHPGQMEALESDSRFTLVLAGSQGGKTVIGPLWMLLEIQSQGPGEYLVVAPNFSLMEKKLLPEFRRLFEETLQLGSYTGSPIRRFILSPGGQAAVFGEPSDTKTVIHFGYAASPESLESMTVKGAWLDECGQPEFKLESWEAIQRRLSIHQGRALLTSTPYSINWLKSEIYDRAAAGDSDYRTINFASTMNPAFPQEEFERAKSTLPGWRFRMFYMGEFTRPAGSIFDCFNDEHLIPRTEIPDSWRRVVGLDFGGINTAAVVAAINPENQDILIHGIYAPKASRTAAEHVKALLSQSRIDEAIGGSKSEGQWRSEFRAAGLRVLEPPISEVEVGIDRVYGAFKSNKLHIFKDLTPLIVDLRDYRRKTDSQGNPTAEIEDKASHHFCDATRYLISHLTQPIRTPQPQPIVRRTPRWSGYS